MCRSSTLILSSVLLGEEEGFVGATTVLIVFLAFILRLILNRLQYQLLPYDMRINRVLDLLL